MKFADLIQVFCEYIQNNTLNVDKSTYFAIVIGQITIFGILLAFYQFITSYYQKDDSRYLGYNLAEYHVKKTVCLLDKVVSKKWFVFLFILEITYKPIIAIYGELLPMHWGCIMNFIWFFLVILYFIVFVGLFFQCLNCMFDIKINNNRKEYDKYIYGIEKEFFKTKKKNKTYKNQSEIEKLRTNIEWISNEIKDDNNNDMLRNYDTLIKKQFSKYYSWRKRNELSQTKKGSKSSRKHMTWIDNEEQELSLLEDIVAENYYTLNDDNKWYVFDFYMELVELNWEKIKSDAYRWKDVALKTYQLMSDESKKKVVGKLWKSANNYCDECLKYIIDAEMERIFADERKPEDVRKIFTPIIREEEINSAFAKKILNMIIENNKFDASEMIEWLNERNCVYLFTYIIIYYSIYRFRTEWKFINIKVLKTLWKKYRSLDSSVYCYGYSIDDIKKEVSRKIKSSNIAHRYNDGMQNKLVEYIGENANWKLFNKVKNEGVIDVFYVWVIKVCITDRDGIYSWDAGNFNAEVLVDIINGLIKHDELMEQPSVLRWLQDMRSIVFDKMSYIPQNLAITFRSLLLVYLNAYVVADYAKKFYCYYDSVGTYLLCKIDELSDEIQQDEKIKSAVKYAFISSKLNPNDYMKRIEDECCICKCEIKYDKRKKMRKYLKMLDCLDED